MDLSQGFRKLRFDSGLNQNVVAKKAKISQKYLSQIETGAKSPSLEAIGKILKVYKVPMATLIWSSISEMDVPPNKRESFVKLKASADPIVSELVKYLSITSKTNTTKQ